MDESRGTDLVDAAVEVLTTVARVAEGTSALAMRWARATVRAVRRPSEASEELIDLLVPRIVKAVLDRVDITRVVLERVDLSRIIDGVDIDAVARRIDLDAIIDRLPIERVIELLDLDDIVAQVDFEKILARIDVNAVAAGVDLDAIVARIDLAGLANDVIGQIDLPEIIRESSGAMASETLVGVRLQGIEADERVNRIVNRLLLRRAERAPRPITIADVPHAITGSLESVETL
jgi:hypothetical protein